MIEGLIKKLIKFLRRLQIEEIRTEAEIISIAFILRNIWDTYISIRKVMYILEEVLESRTRELIEKYKDIIIRKYRTDFINKVKEGEIKSYQDIEDYVERSIKGFRKDLEYVNNCYYSIIEREAGQDLFYLIFYEFVELYKREVGIEPFLF